MVSALFFIGIGSMASPFESPTHREKDDLGVILFFVFTLRIRLHV